MKFNFRQGVQDAPIVSGDPSFLEYNNANNTINVIVGTDLVRATAAWKDVNYLIEERENSVDRWGPFLVFGTFYLYWDINLATGAVTRGFTDQAPTYGLTEPSAPEIDQHWFDTNVNIMKVWDGVLWRQKVRVFAATYQSGGHVITEFDLGSQVGIFTNGTQEIWFDHGYILYGIDQKAIKNSDGSMVTTVVPLNTYHGTFSSPIRLELSNSTYLAGESLPAFSAIAAWGDGTIVTASGGNIDRQPIGIVTIPAVLGDPVDVVFSGIVYNDQWNWDALEGSDIFCDGTGLLFQGPPSTTGYARIGTILDYRSILVDIDHLANSGVVGLSGFSGYSGYPGTDAGSSQTVQIFNLYSMSDLPFDGTTNLDWTVDPIVGYDQPAFVEGITTEGTTFNFLIPGTYEMRIHAKATNTTGFSGVNGGDPFNYGLIVGAGDGAGIVGLTKSVHRSTEPNQILTSSNDFSFVDSYFMYTPAVGGTMTIQSYIESYSSLTSVGSWVLNVTIQRIGDIMKPS